MKPMTAATGPRTIPITAKQQTSEMMPVIKDAMASPSVRLFAYCMPPPPGV
jgi:hypothetical protein